MGELIFTNKANLKVLDIKARIELHLIDGDFFLPNKWGLKALNDFEWDKEIDHTFHELYSLETQEMKQL